MFKSRSTLPNAGIPLSRMPFFTIQNNSTPEYCCTSRELRLALEDTSSAPHRWPRFHSGADQNGVRMAFSRPGKPTDNAFVESFNGTFRAECLDAHWFRSLTETQQIVETWRRRYNESRPHRALGERTPNEFANEIAASRDFIGMQTAENSPRVGTKKPVRSAVPLPSATLRYRKRSPAAPELCPFSGWQFAPCSSRRLALGTLEGWSPSLCFALNSYIHPQGRPRASRLRRRR
jgi:hypothetical protein